MTASGVKDLRKGGRAVEVGETAPVDRAGLMDQGGGLAISDESVAHRQKSLRDSSLRNSTIFSRIPSRTCLIFSLRTSSSPGSQIGSGNAQSLTSLAWIF